MIVPLIEKLKSRVPDLRLVILFGSFAAGWARADSDIDLAFASTRPLEGHALFDLKMDMQVGCERHVDLVDLANETVSVILKNEIIRSGQVAFEIDDVVLSEFETRILRDHGDFMYRRREIDEAVGARLKAYAHD